MNKRSRTPYDMFIRRGLPDFEEDVPAEDRTWLERILNGLLQPDPEMRDPLTYKYVKERVRKAEECVRKGASHTAPQNRNAPLLKEQ